MAVPGPGGAHSALGVSATTLISGAADVDTAGWVFTVIVTTAGSAGALYDYNATTGYGAANLIAVVPATVGPVQLGGFPYSVGLVYVPGADQVASISYT